MIVFWGTRLYGKMHRCRGTFVATQFFYLQFLPLVPLGSKLVLEELEGGQYRSLPLSLDLRSVALAYLRTWGLLIALACLFGFFADQSHAMSDGPYFGLLVACLAAAAGLIMGALALGRLSQEARAHRLVYERLTGVPVDVALLQQGSELRQRLHQAVVEHAEPLAATGYRTSYNSESEWGQIALAATTSDVPLLCAALTLARVDWARARGAERRRLRTLHGQLWQKLKGLDGDLVAQARTA